MRCASPPPRAPFYIVGRGCTLPLHQGSQGQRPRGGGKGGGGQGRARPPPKNPNPGRLGPGPRHPLLVLFPNGLLSGKLAH
jgi:hypothetical protein